VGTQRPQGACTRWEGGSTSALGPAEAEAAAPGPRDVAVEVAAAAAADLEKVLERVWSGGGGTVGAFAQALERTRDSAAAFRDAAAAEMRKAAARHRDMASFRSRLESPSPAIRRTAAARGRNRRGEMAMAHHLGKRGHATRGAPADATRRASLTGTWGLPASPPQPQPAAGRGPPRPVSRAPLHGARSWNGTERAG
jgi:hypothetical protein